MAIDFDAIRRKLNKLSGQNSRQNTSWRPQEGEEHTVRLLSFPDNDGQPFKELWFYYNIGNNPGLLAPYQFGNPDPIQELITKLRDDGSKESYELAKKLYPKMRCYAPVVVRGEEDKGVRIWAFGKTVYQSLLNIMLDEDYGDITDTESSQIKVKLKVKVLRLTLTLDRTRSTNVMHPARFSQSPDLPAWVAWIKVSTPSTVAPLMNGWSRASMLESSRVAASASVRATTISGVFMMSACRRAAMRRWQCSSVETRTLPPM